jgi:hypothetical protein
MSSWMAAGFVGTFALVFAGTGAIVVNSASRGVAAHPLTRLEDSPTSPRKAGRGEERPFGA